MISMYFTNIAICSHYIYVCLFQKAHLYMNSVLPIILITISDTYLLYKVFTKGRLVLDRREDKNDDHKKQSVIFVILIY